MSKLAQWAAALACGLLLQVSPAALAASQNSAAKSAAVNAKSVTGQAKKVTRPAKSPSRGKNAKRSTAATGDQVGPADMLDADSVGLRGLASFYGHGFSGRRTSTGEVFDVRQFTAASNRFPLGTRVAVHRLDNDRCAIVRVNDRMHGKHRRRVIDVSRGVAEYLGMIRAGVVMVRVAALPKESGEEGGGACRSAFDDAEPDSDGLPQKMPDFQIGHDG